MTVALAGNLQGTLDVLQRAGVGLHSLAAGAPRTTSSPPSDHWWWWRSSRVLEDRDAGRRARRGDRRVPRLQLRAGRRPPARAGAALRASWPWRWRSTATCRAAGPRAAEGRAAGGGRRRDRLRQRRRPSRGGAGRPGRDVGVGASRRGARRGDRASERPGLAPGRPPAGAVPDDRAGPGAGRRSPTSFIRRRCSSSRSCSARCCRVSSCCCPIRPRGLLARTGDRRGPGPPPAGAGRVWHHGAGAGGTRSPSRAGRAIRGRCSARARCWARSSRGCGGDGNACGARAIAARALGCALVLAPEVVYLHDDFGTRMNTVFKLYYQAWLLLGLASASPWRPGGTTRRAGVAWPRAVARPWPRPGLVFTAAARLGRNGRLRVRLAFARRARRRAPDERAAIDWVRSNVPPGAIILQARSAATSPERRASARPPAGPRCWGGKGTSGSGAAQGYDAMAAGRAAGADRGVPRGDPAPPSCPRSTAWRVRYVVVGPAERRRYARHDASDRLME